MLHKESWNPSRQGEVILHFFIVFFNVTEGKRFYSAIKNFRKKINKELKCACQAGAKICLSFGIFFTWDFLNGSVFRISDNANVFVIMCISLLRLCFHELML